MPSGTAGVPPCPKCGYPELKEHSEDYYRAMGVDTQKQAEEQQS
jgi:hypothetical protein